VVKLGNFQKKQLLSVSFIEKFQLINFLTAKKGNFMRTIYSIILVTALVLFGCSGPTAVVAPKSAAYNGLPDLHRPGWEENITYHERTGFSYAFEYDNKNLYLYLTTSDQNLQRKVVYYGLTIWVDRFGGNNKDQGFSFPLGAFNRQAGSPMPRSAFNNDLATSLKWADKIDLIGIYGTSTRTEKMRDSRIRVKSELNDGILVYHAVIPYELLHSGFNPLNGKSGISIGLETGSPEPDQAARRQMPQDGIRPGGGMTGRGTGQMPGQAGSRMPEREQMAQRGTSLGELSRPTRLWIDLEFKPEPK
jgi:hypothetical protein